MPAKISLIGKTFGKLKVIADAPMRRTSGGRAKLYYHCVCECGNNTEVYTAALASGMTRSCGCLRDTTSYVSRMTHGHGNLKNRTYSSWMHMKSRCGNPKQNGYHNYGGRGICVCQRWLDSFENFLADMGECPEGHSLDRKDSNGNYEPANCRWATRREQLRNKRTNVVLTVGGVTGCITTLCEHFGLNRAMVYTRLNQYKWTVERAFNQAPRRRNLSA